MLAIDISALSQAELRQLLAVARAREQHALVAQLTAELAARPSRSVQGSSPGPIMSSWPTREPVTQPPPRRRRVAVAITAGAAGFLVAALVWGVSIPSAAPPMTAVKIAAPRMSVAIASPAPELAAPAVIEAVAAAAPSRPRPQHNACYDQPTPADRLVCGYPSLADRERRLRAAIATAIASGAEPQALEAEQAAWKAGRDGVSDRLALADLYDRRILDLAESGQ